MTRLIALWDLVTTDAMTLTAACVLALALLGLLLLVFWPGGITGPGGGGTARSHEARELVSAGIPLQQIARRTGLSRDAIVVLTSGSHPAQRQKAPGAARTSAPRRPAVEARARRRWLQTLTGQ